MYSSYQTVRCKARLAGKYSDRYTMECGIHQLRYTTFIDPLIQILEQSNLGYKIAGISVNPVGYADDMASATLSKTNVDKSQKYAKKWRYSYNAKKSVILFFGESRREHERGVKYRNFYLNGDKVP